MAGKHITDDIPLNIGNPGISGFWTNNAENYDVAFSGLPFFMANTDATPYGRATAPYRKEQFDSSKEPGEQSLTGWWLRSQSSFHNGAGVKFYDPTTGESIPYRFKESKGVNPWVKGQVSLLNQTFEGHVTTTAVDAYKRTRQHVRSISYGTYDGVLLHDGYDVDKINIDGTETHFIDYNAGTDEPVYAICDDGVNAYWVTNQTESASSKLHMFKKPLSGSSTTGATTPTLTGDVTKMFHANGIVIATATMEFIKDRIVLCVNNVVYEISPTATALPTAIYTNPNTNYVYTSITASGPAIYTTGFSGIYSTIQKFTLNASTNAMNGGTTLSQASVAAEFPPGEVVHKIYYYLSYMAIGTSRGVRIAMVNDQDGSIAYGPLTIETTQPCYDFVGRDRFLWCATGQGADAGVSRIDLSANIEGEALRFAYTNDIFYTSAGSNPTTGVTFFGTSSRLAFCTAYNLVNTGRIYIEDLNNLCTSGYIITGAIRYGTLEPKNYKFIRVRGDVTNGSIDVQSIDDTNTTYPITTFNSFVGLPEAATTQPEGSQEYISFKFTLSRDTSTTSLGPILNGYQTKALPATKRQRLIQFAVWCYDLETDRFGVQTGYRGRAWERIQLLETLEELGDIINVQDFTTDERVQAIIEKISFERKTPPSGDYSGFGGILLVTVSTVL